MRILTANLREGLADPNALRALLVEFDVDVACFQELGPAQAEAVRDALPLEGRRAFRTQVDGMFELLNVHVMAPVARSKPHAGLLRLRQVRQLLDHLDATPEQPRLLLGDLNSTTITPAYRALTTRLRDLHLEYAHASGWSASPTWGLQPGARLLLRLDHALGAGVEVTRVGVVTIEGSDHAECVIEMG